MQTRPPAAHRRVSRTRAGLSFSPVRSGHRWWAYRGVGQLGQELHAGHQWRARGKAGEGACLANRRQLTSRRGLRSGKRTSTRPRFLSRVCVRGWRSRRQRPAHGALSALLLSSRGGGYLAWPSPTSSVAGLFKPRVLLHDGTVVAFNRRGRRRSLSALSRSCS